MSVKSKDSVSGRGLFLRGEETSLPAGGGDAQGKVGHHQKGALIKNQLLIIQMKTQSSCRSSELGALVLSSLSLGLGSVWVPRRQLGGPKEQTCSGAAASIFSG